jgi:5-methylthioadenosine/S-adenosylhomocysteine deaminase
MAAPPIRDGAVLVGPDGRIAALGTDAAVPDGDAMRMDLPGAILLPGLVNTHTHLELTGFDRAPDDDPEPAWGDPFVDWIRTLIRRKAGRDSAAYLEAARQGLRDGFAAGVTSVADTGDSGAALLAMAEAGVGGVAFLEVFGPDPAGADSAFAAWRERFDGVAVRATGRARIGVSPHAPYSVSGPLYARAAAFARERDLPMAVHVAESAAESALLAEGSGGFARMLASRGIPLPGPGTTPIAWLDQHGVLGRRTLCIHAIRVSDDDVGTLAARGAAVAHCPRSNAAHGHGEAPLRMLLDAGIRVGAGTDSVASAAPLDLLAEARAARGLANLRAEEALALVTTGAARAISLDREVGSLAPGLWADLAAFRDRPGMDPVEAVLASGPGDVMGTWVAGRQAWPEAT